MLWNRIHFKFKTDVIELVTEKKYLKKRIQIQHKIEAKNIRILFFYPIFQYDYSIKSSAKKKNVIDIYKKKSTHLIGHALCECAALIKWTACVCVCA